jgi:hypothetical protein
MFRHARPRHDANLRRTVTLDGKWLTNVNQNSLWPTYRRVKSGGSRSSGGKSGGTAKSLARELRELANRRFHLSALLMLMPLPNVTFINLHSQETV